MLKGRTWIGMLTGLAGAGLMGWALFTAFTAACLESAARVAASGSCSSSPSGWVALAIPGGIVLAVIGMFLGGGFLVFAGLFLAVGLSALIPTWLGLMPDMELFGWLFGGIFFLCGLLPLFLGLAGGRMLARKRELAETLYQTGAKGVGTIVEVTDTGMTINDNPHVKIRMRVDPIDGGPPVERSKTVTVSRVAIPRAGERFPVWYDRADEEKWMFGVDMEDSAPADVKDMFARARAAGGDAADEADDSPVAELERLTGLWKDGALTDAEFADAKAWLLPKIGR
ncbi:MAG TPA: hypothetical protein VEC11_06190 [Allosphingosinicella sp.]|nr:hypothetical protein [Allosphingosinicella sp.]